MNYSISIRKEAEADISEAFQYYESCRINLGHDFILCIEESFARIAKNPDQYQTVHRNVHRALIHRFPYGVFYIVDENDISVIGILHARKNPIHWQLRT